MIVKKVSLDIVVGVTSRLPETQMPEIAFAGRSNVGKSSLINALMNRKSYARVSASPGKTQTVNYYNINDELYLVDLPGYGFTKAAVKVKEQWGKMVERYLKNSPNLKAVFLLADSRHAPSALDRQMFEWVVASGFRPVVIATKGDKLKKNEIEKNKKLIRSVFRMQPEDKLILTSSLKKTCIDEVWETVEKFI